MAKEKIEFIRRTADQLHFHVQQFVFDIEYNKREEQFLTEDIDNLLSEVRDMKKHSISLAKEMKQKVNKALEE